ncbi:MAG TPA: efflux RND transporter periplasmic adaptor subunit [Terriglobales bacterium]|nr:efflux RND transporter periplasmic adaptor subunit [Terriglobales bacterium]
MKLLKNKWLMLGVVVVAVVLFAAFGLTKKDKTQYFTAKTDRGDIREVVEATGTINAVTSVQVGSQVSGNVYRLHADFNSKVKKGELIAELEPSLFKGAVDQAKADLSNARANLVAAKANLLKAKATETQTKADYDRTLGLTKEGVMSQQQLDLAKANYDSAVAASAAAEATVQQSAAQVSQKQAAVEVSQTNLNHTYIYAPIDGVVVNRAVDVGQTVAASLQAPTLFTIAQDLTKMQVYTATDESDVGMIKPGQPVNFKVDAFPRDTFRGRVSQVRLNPTTVQNVVTYTTVIDFDNPDLKLFPGMTAYVTIPVAQARQVIRVPNGALRYNPDMKPDEIRALLKQNGIEMGGGRRQQQAQAGEGGQQGGQQGGQNAPAAESSAQNAAPAAGGQQGGGRRGAGQGGDNAQARFGGGRYGQRGGASGGGMGGPNAGRMGGNEAGSPGGGPGMHEQRLDVGIVWKLGPENKLIPVQVRTGITDHTVTEVVQVLHGELKEGDELIVGSAGKRSGPGGPGGPMGGRGPGR